MLVYEGVTEMMDFSWVDLIGDTSFQQEDPLRNNRLSLDVNGTILLQI